MTYSQQVQNMCPITKGPKHGPAPIPEEGAWVKGYEIKDISGYTHGVGWCAPQQGTCKLSLNIIPAQGQHKQRDVRQRRRRGRRPR